MLQFQVHGCSENVAYKNGCSESVAGKDGCSENVAGKDLLVKMLRGM